MVGKDIITTASALAEELEGLADTEYIAVGGDSAFYFIGTVEQYRRDIDAVNMHYELSFWRGVEYAGENAVGVKLDGIILKEEHERGEAYKPNDKKKRIEELKVKLAKSLASTRTKGENKCLTRPYKPAQTALIKKAYYRKTEGEPVMRVYITDSEITGDVWLLSEYEKRAESYRNSENRVKGLILKYHEKYKGRYKEI